MGDGRPSLCRLGCTAYDEEAARLRAGERWSDCRWWKWWALKNWLTEHPEIDAVVWCDDDLGRAFFDLNDDGDIDQGWALTRRMFASVELERRGLRTLLLAPATATGLIPNDLELIENFLRDESTTSPPRMPTDLQFPASIDTLVPFTGRESRRCARCDSASWYLRHAPFVVDSTTCGHIYYGPYDVTNDVPPPRPSASRYDDR